MKVIAGLVLGMLAVCGIGAGAVALGLIPSPITAPQRNVQGLPPLKPLAQSNVADISVTLSERYLNQQLARGVAQDAQVSNTQMDLHANNLANISATVQVNSLLRVTPNISLQLGTANGRIVINVLQVNVGGFGVPSSLIEPQIQQLKQNTENDLNGQLIVLQNSTGLKLQTLSTTENSLTLEFGQ